MIEINVINHPLGGSRAESIASATIDEYGRVTAWSGTVRTQTLVERRVFDRAQVWHQIAEIAQAVADAQQTATTRERPDSPVVRRWDIVWPNVVFRGTTVKAFALPLFLTTDDALAEFLEANPTVKRLQVVRAIKRAFDLLERDAPLDFS